MEENITINGSNFLLSFPWHSQQKSNFVYSISAIFFNTYDDNDDDKDQDKNKDDDDDDDA